MRLTATGEAFLGLVVVDDAGDVETAPLEPFLHQGRQTDVDGLADVGPHEVRLGSAVDDDHLAVGSNLLQQTFRTAAIGDVAAHDSVDVEEIT